MKKARTYVYIILCTLFVVLSVIAFSVPTNKTVTFWISYVFTIISFAVQIITWRMAFGKEETLKSKFLGIPVVHIGCIYLIVQIVAFIVFLIFPMLPSWSAILACLLIFTVSVISIISADVGRSEIEQIDAKIKEKTHFIKELNVKIEMIASIENDSLVKDALQKISDKVRFSDPVSCPELSELEAVISAKVLEIENSSDKIETIRELDLLLTERNKKCKIYK